MIDFDESEQQKKIERLHKHEQEELAKTLSEKYEIPYVDLSSTSIQTRALKLVKEEEARKAQIAPFDKVGHRISVAVKHPQGDKTREALKRIENKGYQVKLHMASENSLERAWDYYDDISYTSDSKSGVLGVSAESIKEEMEKMENVEDVKENIQKVIDSNKTYQTSKIVEILFAAGLTLDASDVHIEPAEDYVRVRFRLDGVLHDIMHIDKEPYDLIRSRLKLVSGLKLNVADRPQDGRFSIELADREIEVRTSSLPGNYGESIVMRLLDPRSIQLSMEDLGMSNKILRTLKSEIKKPHGMMLVTGPTGSGKTTSLYSFLGKINQPETKLITIENPIEYHLEGVVQTQVKEGKYTFLQGLRSALRQDPDVIMLGEIRDEEVAETAVNAALTGHLVFSTLHTNTAAGAFPRLIDLGIDAKVISSAVNIAVAQRLVRKLCPECKKEVKLEGKDKKIVDKVLSEVKDKNQIPEKKDTVHKPVGCEECNNIGYKGRIGIFEAVLMDEDVAKVVRKNPAESDIKKASEDQGILSMTQSGVVKVLQGMTSLKELDRVVELPEVEKEVEDH